MANRFPLILNTSSNQLQELPSGDSLDLTGSGLNMAGGTNINTGTRGDILVYNASGNVTKLNIGTNGQVLKSNGSDIVFGDVGATTNVYYVAKHGADNDPSSDTGRGTSLDKPWLTIAYAINWMNTNVAASTNKTLFVKTGEYSEALPIVVGANTQVIGDGLRSTRIVPASGNSTAAGLTNTPNARADMFRVRNGVTFTGFTFSGMLGTMTTADANGVARPTTTDGATRSGVVFALDPGTGVGDTSTHITSKSPFIQNCSHFGTGSVGIKIDGALHNAGNRSILANDFTQITSGGVGVWVLANAKSELVSVFTYYAHHGYLADSRGVIRSLNSNNSYGEYGSTAAGIDANETPYTANVDLSNYEAQVGRVLVSGSGIGRLEFQYAGEGYTSAPISIAGSGASGTATSNIANGAVKYIEVNTNGATHFTTTGFAQSGTSSTIKLAASDSQPDDFYNGMRITVYTGTGYGNTGVITDYVASTKTCTVQKENGSAGFDVFVNSGLSAATAFDTTSGYEIEPRVALSGGGSPTRDALARAVVENQQVSKILILDGGAGYSSAPTVTITDPNASTVATATSYIGNGVISQTTVSSAGSGYKTETTTATVTGDGYAEISSAGTAFVRLLVYLNHLLVVTLLSLLE